MGFKRIQNAIISLSRSRIKNQDLWQTLTCDQSFAFALHERLLAARQLEGYNRMQPIGMTRGLSSMMVFARFQSISFALRA